MDKNRPRIKPRIHEWMTQDSCIREKFVDGWFVDVFWICHKMETARMETVCLS